MTGRNISFQTPLSCGKTDKNVWVTKNNFHLKNIIDFELFLTTTKF